MSLYMNETRWSRMQKAIDWSLQQMVFPRRERFDSFQQYCGSHYAEGGAERIVPVNFLALAVMIYVRRLAARAPTAMLTTTSQELRPLAADFQEALNLVPGEINLVHTLRQWVTEAMFSPWGVIKCGLNGGKTFADLVTLDDYFIDMSATRMDTIDFEGNDYWEDYDKIMEDKSFTNKDGLMRDERTPLGPNGERRSQNISVDQTMQTYKDKKWLRDVWLPEEGLLVTTSVRDKRVIREVDLDEMRHSPYHKLSFNLIPGQLMPLPAVGLWRDLHDLGNSLFRKLANGADSQKSCLGFLNDQEGVNEFKGARDGDGFNFTGPDPKVLKAGGIDPQTMLFFLQTRDLMSYFAGNLDSLGGLGAQSETAAQDKLIQGAASAQLDDMQDQTITATEILFQSLAYYEWEDPQTKRVIEKKVPGIDMTIPVEFGPAQRRNADFGAFYIKIDVHSMQKDSPQIKLQKLKGIVEQFILPLEPAITAQGGVIDVKSILKRAGEYANFPEADEFVVFVDMPIRQGGPASGAGMRGPATTTRRQEYVGGGQSSQSQTAQMMQQLMSAGSSN
jgi:hypothetical protein